MHWSERNMCESGTVVMGNSITTLRPMSATHYTPLGSPGFDNRRVRLTKRSNSELRHAALIVKSCLQEGQSWVWKGNTLLHEYDEAGKPLPPRRTMLSLSPGCLQLSDREIIEFAVPSNRV
eukprot:5471033-Amphidinium_carterae.1